MPTPTAEAREDWVVDLVVADLQASGEDVEIVARPDRTLDRSDGLTVDAELLIGGRKWALEVVLLRWRPELESAVDVMAKRLKAEVGDRIDAAQQLRVTCHVSKDSTTVGRVVDLVRAAIESGSDLERGDEAVSFHPRLDDDSVLVLPWLGSTADVRAEVVATLGEAVAKKLRGQLRRATELGFSAALVIDQGGPGDLRYGTNFLASEATVASVIEERELIADLRLDAVALIDRRDVVRWLRPTR